MLCTTVAPSNDRSPVCAGELAGGSCRRVDDVGGSSAATTASCFSASRGCEGAGSAEAGAAAALPSTTSGGEDSGADASPREENHLRWARDVEAPRPVATASRINCVRDRRRRLSEGRDVEAPKLLPAHLPGVAASGRCTGAVRIDCRTTSRSGRAGAAVVELRREERVVKPHG